VKKASPKKSVVFYTGINLGPCPDSILKNQEQVQFHIFEPHRDNFLKLSRTLRARINSGSVCLSSAGASTRTDEKSITLDKYCSESNIIRIDLLTINSPANAILILMGAEELLARGRIDYILIDHGDDLQGFKARRKKIFAYLKEYRYTLFERGFADLCHIPSYVSELSFSGANRILAVNERLGALTLGRNPEMLPLADLFRANSLMPRGVIHVGAHEGQELDDYLAMGVNTILFIEANPVVFSKLQENISTCRGARAVCCATGNEDGETTLHITSMDQSSSILPLKLTLDVYPDIVETEQISVPCKKLDSLMEEENLDPADYNILNIDVQGAELLALKGASRTLRHIDAINVEVNFEELYSGCALIHEIDLFLESLHFKRGSTTCPFHPSWGDALYVKDRVLTMSTLGANGRFANQIFQYAFLRLYALKHELRIETPSWIGQILFGHSDPPISRNLPMVVEKSDNLIEARSSFASQTYTNVDIWGYFQYHSSFYSPYKRFFRSLFKPSQEIEQKLLPALERIREMGKTLIGIHLRRGDYGHGPFFIAPNRWYLEWLNDIWQQQDQPVLFLASDEPAEVIEDLSRFNPLTAQGLGCKLPEADFYPDFYFLSKCDIMAISNSSFSFAASMLNQNCRLFMRPHLRSGRLIPYDPWSANPILTDAMVEGSGIEGVPVEKHVSARIGVIGQCRNPEEQRFPKSLADNRILYVNHKLFHGRSGPFFSQQERILKPDPEKLISRNCTPETEKTLSVNGGHLTFDIHEQIDKVLPGWNPDLFIARIDSSTESLPCDVGKLHCPKILVIGEMLPERCPVERVIEYARSEKFDFYLCDQSRLHLRVLHLAGLKHLFWFPGLFHTAPGGMLEEKEFENSEFTRDQFRNKTIHSGIFDAATHPRKMMFLDQLKEEFDNFWSGYLSQNDSFKASYQADIALNIDEEGDFFSRILEIIGSQGFLLTELPGSDSGLNLLFNQWEHYHTFQGISNLRKKIAHFSSHPEESKNCRAKANIRYLEEFHPEKSSQRLSRLIKTGEIEDIYSIKSLNSRKYLIGFKSIAIRFYICHLLNKLHRELELVRVSYDSRNKFCGLEDFLLLPFTKVSVLNADNRFKTRFMEIESSSYNEGRVEFIDERSTSFHVFVGNSFDLETVTANDKVEFAIIFTENSRIKLILERLDLNIYSHTLTADPGSGINQLHIIKKEECRKSFKILSKLEIIWMHLKRALTGFGTLAA